MRRYQYIYIMECAGFYKVGITYDLEKRLKSIKGQNTLPVTLVKAYNMIEDALLYEQEIHRRLAKHQLWGEWFKCDLELIESTVRNVVGDIGVAVRKNSQKNKIQKQENRKIIQYCKGDKFVTYNGDEYYFTGEKRKPVEGDIFVWNDSVYTAGSRKYEYDRYIVYKNEPINRNNQIAIAKWLKSD